ncbi:MAG: DUF1565 domain-containing protein, partial [Candidatus Aminicenantes bacterium]|nr:DUF1565 domain-containing protein [Candidatus Aminicenantes bacterium]
MKNVVFIFPLFCALLFAILLAPLFSFASASLQDLQWGKAAEYHVALTGNDSNPGSSVSPWRTIQHAANSVVPGATVTIHEGSYEEEVVFANSGTADASITFSAAAGETVTVEGLELAAGTSFVDISGLRVEG